MTAWIENLFGADLPTGWTTAGPFGMWSHASGATVVNVEPGYAATTAEGQELGEFETLDEAFAAVEAA